MYVRRHAGLITKPGIEQEPGRYLPTVTVVLLYNVVFLADLLLNTLARKSGPHVHMKIPHPRCASGLRIITISITIYLPGISFSG